MSEEFSVKPVDLSELEKLAALLKEAGIQFDWHDLPKSGGAEIKVPSMTDWWNGFGISVVCFDGTWGADRGLLECWVRTKKLRQREPMGWLTGETVFKIIKGDVL